MLTRAQIEILQGRFDQEAIRRAQVRAGMVEPQTEEERIDRANAELADMWRRRAEHQAAMHPTKAADRLETAAEFRQAAAAFLVIADLLEGMQND